MKELTRERLTELIVYNPETGEFNWNDISATGCRGRRRVNPIGSGLKRKYRCVNIDGKNYALHRLAWYLTFQEIPFQIDHIDGDTHNNRISNLRNVSNIENQQNRRKAHRNNVSGFLGVEYQPKYGNYRARIVVNKKIILLGCFSDPIPAHQAYLEAKRRLHPTCTI